jgi:hypothetical protein
MKSLFQEQSGTIIERRDHWETFLVLLRKRSHARRKDAEILFLSSCRDLNQENEPEFYSRVWRSLKLQ